MLPKARTAIDAGSGTWETRNPLERVPYDGS